MSCLNFVGSQVRTLSIFNRITYSKLNTKDANDFITYFTTSKYIQNSVSYGNHCIS